MDLECRQHPPDPIAAQNRQSGPNQCSGQNHRCTIIGVQVTPSQSEMARWPLIVTHLSALNKVWHGASNRQRDLRKDKSKILSCTSFALFTDGRMQSCTFPTGIPVHTNFCSWVSTLTTLSTGYLESTMCFHFRLKTTTFGKIIIFRQKVILSTSDNDDQPNWSIHCHLSWLARRNK